MGRAPNVASVALSGAEASLAAKDYRAVLELTTIARAKVEVAYGRHELGSDGLRRVAEAYQRLRFALLGFILRRGFRRRRRRGSRR